MDVRISNTGLFIEKGYQIFLTRAIKCIVEKGRKIRVEFQDIMYKHREKAQCLCKGESRGHLMTSGLV